MISTGDVINLNIDSAAFEGKGVGRINGFVVFVPYAVPGDVVEARVTRRRRDYAEARILKVIQPSAYRREPKCRYSGICGGCRWQQLDYEKQAEYKRQHVIDALQRIGNIQTDVLPIIKSDQEYAYRNKIELTFSDNPYRISDNDDSKVSLGFHAPGRFDRTIDIEHCDLVDERMNEIIRWFREYIDPRHAERVKPTLSIYNSLRHEGVLRFLVIRKSFATQEIMVLLFVYRIEEGLEILSQKLKSDLPYVSSFVTIVNPTLSQVASGNVQNVHFGSGYITDKIGELKFRISPLSFFQTNTLQAQKLYSVVSAAIEREVDTIYDLYSGTGSIACYLSTKAKNITGFEMVESAVEDAKTNARLNGITNVEFVKANLDELFKFKDDSLIQLKDMSLPEIIVLDPPRSGIHPKIAQNLHKLNARKIIYVSCNPMTQARDVREILAHGYRPVYCQPVDMFPQTYHVENVLVLERD
ncbi:MAG: 23S rRNA (uracil(1939)-C(5))-methyltransferase RlmD [Candidatus Kryptoniota bacterium]